VCGIPSPGSNAWPEIFDARMAALRKKRAALLAEIKANLQVK
jgi:hypothetical protein